MISQEMVSYVNMFGSRMVHGIVSQLDCTLIITQEWNLTKLTTKVAQGEPHPK
jgi:hypothetical protein